MILIRSLFTETISDEILQTAISWWKFKVIEKRPLMKDDAKALRMIKGKIKKLLKGITTDD